MRGFKIGLYGALEVVGETCVNTVEQIPLTGNKLKLKTNPRHIVAIFLADSPEIRSFEQLCPRQFASLHLSESPILLPMSTRVTASNRANGSLRVVYRDKVIYRDNAPDNE